MHKHSMAAAHANQNFASESHFLNAPLYLPSLWGLCAVASFKQRRQRCVCVSVRLLVFLRRFSERPVCHQLHPPPLSSQRTLVFTADRRALFSFFFSEIKHLRAKFAGQHCFISFRLFSSAFSVVDEWTLLYFNFGNDFLKTRMDSLLHCGEEKHNKESFNLQLCDCQHSKRSAAGGATS